MSGGEGKRLLWENKAKQKTAVVLATEHAGLDKDGSRGRRRLARTSNGQMLGERKGPIEGKLGSG